MLGSKTKSFLVSVLRVIVVTFLFLVVVGTAANFNHALGQVFAALFFVFWPVYLFMEYRKYKKGKDLDQSYKPEELSQESVAKISEPKQVWNKLAIFSGVFNFGLLIYMPIVGMMPLAMFIGIGFAGALNIWRLRIIEVLILLIFGFIVLTCGTVIMAFRQRHAVILPTSFKHMMLVPFALLLIIDLVVYFSFLPFHILLLPFYSGSIDLL